MNMSSLTHKPERKIQIKRLDDGKNKDSHLVKDLKSHTEIKDRSRTPIRSQTNNQVSHKHTASTKEIKKDVKDPKDTKDVKEVKDVKDVKPHLPERSKTPVREKPATPTIPKKIKHVENNLNKSALIESTKTLDKTIDVEKKEDKKQTKRGSVIAPTGGEKRSSLYQSTQSSLLKTQAPKDKDSAPNTGNYHTERDTKRKSSVIVEKRNSLLNSVDKLDKGARKSSVMSKGPSLNISDSQNQKRKSQYEQKVVRRETKKENKETPPKDEVENTEKIEKLGDEKVIIKNNSEKLENSEKSNKDSFSENQNNQEKEVNDSKKF
jgi:hypothetical protein